MGHGGDCLSQFEASEGLVSFGGISYPICADSRRNEFASQGCPTSTLMEEVFTATVR